MNLYYVGSQLRVAYFSLRLGRMLGLHRVAKQARLSIAHRRIVAFWLVAGLAFAVPWGWLYYTEHAGPAGELCRVLRVADGDGVRLDCGPSRENLNVRLYCIDAPEMEQAPWGAKSKDHLRQLAADRVRLVDHGTGRWGRTIGQLLSLEGEDINRRMVADGWAVVYPQFCSDPRYYATQRSARASGLGLWAVDGLHQRPWEWRQGQ